MLTISNILQDVDKGCAIHNLNESCFSYRILFFVNEGGTGMKHHADSTYEGLRKTLESIIRENISLTNSVVFAQTTVRKNGKCVCLQSRSYMFNLDEYFKQIIGRKEKVYVNDNYGRRRTQC